MNTGIHRSNSLKHVTWKATLLATLIGVLTFTIALAAPGDLDTTFSGDGRVINFIVPSSPQRWDKVERIALQSDGKIVAAGWSSASLGSDSNFALTRYNTDGSLDTTFSGDGRLTTNFGGRDEAHDIAVQSDGKIVVAGKKCNADLSICDLAVARYKKGGALDITFSGDGKVVTNFPGGDNGSNGGLALLPNGKIVVAGYVWNGTDQSHDFAVYRYNANGTLDTAFSGDGVAQGGFGAGRQDFPQDLVIQPDGKIVVAGYTGDSTGNNNNFAIARLNANGTEDTTFSGDGRQTTNLGANDYAYGVALQADGKIVVVGRKFSASLISIALVRYNANGSLDLTFNGTGKKIFSVISGFISQAFDVLVQPDNKIVVVGWTDTGGSSADFALVRLDTSGSFDNTFGGDGKVTVSFGSLSDAGFTIARQPLDGKYVVGGYIQNGASNFDFALARLKP